jgi:hypothetical protein
VTRLRSQRVARGAGLAARCGGAVAIAFCALALVASASATSYPPDPSTNFALGALPRTCESAPRGGACEHAVIGALDAARARLGLGRYLLPANFVTLAPARQWLILCNLDRIAYRLRPIHGLVLPLDKVAKQGALAHADPDPGPLLRSLTDQQTIGFASNWAGGQQNALIAYFGWMYDDGPGSPNVDCRSAGDAGCWGHRHDILSFPDPGSVAMGAAAVAGSSYALTIVYTQTPPWPFAFTWAQAKRDGAGAS